MEDQAAGGVLELLFGGAFSVTFFLLFVVLPVACLWKVFTKAGKPGWAAIVPVYNIVVLLEIIGKPLWWIILFLIPVLNIVMSLVASLALAAKFDKGGGFGAGLFFLPFVFFPILAFDSSTYRP